MPSIPGLGPQLNALTLGSSAARIEFEPPGRAHLKSLNILIAILGLVFVSTAQAETCGQLAGVRGGEVAILRLQHGHTGQDPVRYAMKIAEKSSTPIECDDVIQAGKDSSARIILATAKLSLGADTRIEIAAHTGGGSGSSEASVSLLNLTYGKLRALVNRKKDPATNESVTVAPGSTVGRKQNKAPGDKADAKSSSADKTVENKVSFEVKTFSAVAGVRGTDFFVSYDPNAGVTQQATIEGSVEVQQTGSTQKVLVESGKQVSVETTPQAVRALQDRVRAGTAKANELPKKLPADEKVKPLVVVAMAEATRETLRRTSAAVSEDVDFSTKKAIETLGAPSTWTIKREPVPDSLKGIKNEY